VEATRNERRFRVDTRSLTKSPPTLAVHDMAVFYCRRKPLL